jgi:hypothetical protein
MRLARLQVARLPGEGVNRRMTNTLSNTQLADVRRRRSYPAGATYVRTNGRVDPVVLGTAPQPIDNDLWADCCIMLAVLAKTQPERVGQFFALSGSAREKVAFLKFWYGAVKGGLA